MTRTGTPASTTAFRNGPPPSHVLTTVCPASRPSAPGSLQDPVLPCSSSWGHGFKRLALVLPCSWPPSGRVIARPAQSLQGEWVVPSFLCASFAPRAQESPTSMAYPRRGALHPPWG